MPLPDTVTHRILQARLLLDRDLDLAMNHQISGPVTAPPPGTHPDHADVLRVANGLVLGVVRLNDGPWLPDWNPFAALSPAQDPPPGTWYVVGDVHDVDLLVLNEADGSIWLVDGEPGGHWQDGTAYRRLTGSLAAFLDDFVLGSRYRELSEIPGDDWVDAVSRLDELQPLTGQPARSRRRPTPMAAVRNARDSPRAMKVPATSVVEKKLADLVTGEIEPDAAAGWAAQVIQELQDEDMDDGIWGALDHLSGADLLAGPGVYLHSQDDYRSWLTEFRSSQAQ